MDTTTEKFKQYVWDKMIAPQLGYSFNLAHGVSYSLIAVQEMNLATRWNPLFWACACLCVNAGNASTDFDEADEDEEAPVEEEAENEVEEGKTKAKTAAPNYGKIAKAISDAQHAGVRIELPNINTAQADFVPDIENNAILYSLQTVNVVNADLLDKIIAGRPYKSLSDFMERVDATTAQMCGLIKAGCFDELEHKSRNAIAEIFLRHIAEKEIQQKEKLTMTQVRQALDLGMYLDKYAKEIRLYKFKKYIDKHQKDPNNQNRYLLNDEQCVKFFSYFVEDSLNASKDEYSYLSPDQIVVKVTAFKRFFDTEMKNLMDYLNSAEGSKAFCELQRESLMKEIRDKYFQGSVAAWEMETMNFYHEPHELAGINTALYNIRDFNSLPENIDFGFDKKYNCAIAGSVIKTDNTKHIVTLLTTTGVVDVKLFGLMYNQYNQKISTIDSKTKKKTVIDDSWFKRGNKLLIYGYRRENTFCAKTDRSSGFNRLVCLINKVRTDNTLDLTFVRKKAGKKN